MVAGEEEGLGDYLGGLGVVVGEGAEEPATVLGSDGDDADRAAWATMYGTAAQVQGVFAELAVDEDVVSGEGDVHQLQQAGGFPDERGAHLSRGGGGLGVDAAGVGGTDDEVEVAHGFGEDDGVDGVQRQGEVVTAPGEIHATDRGQVSFGWGEEAVGELDVSDQVVVVKDTGDSARLV